MLIQRQCQYSDNVNIADTTIENKPTSQPMEKDAESVIKKTISQRYADERAAMHMDESEKQETRRKRQTRRIKKTTDDDSSASSDDEYFIQVFTDRFQTKKITR